jgi:DNA-binding CsgD family transcriptional regulator
LLCQRLTMTEIAAKLMLSPRTVQSYVENIKDKLGVRTKREILEKLLRKEG